MLDAAMAVLRVFESWLSLSHVAVCDERFCNQISIGKDQLSRDVFGFRS